MVDDEARLLACIDALNALAAGAGSLWLAYAAASALLALCGEPEVDQVGTPRRFYVWANVDGTIDAMRRLVSALGDGSNDEVMPVGLLALARLRAQVYAMAGRYLDKCDGGGK